MNCDFCNEHIMATTNVAWNKQNFHSWCIGEAILRHRAAQELIVPDQAEDFSEQVFQESFDEEYQEYQDDIDEFDGYESLEPAIEKLDTIVPEVMPSDFQPQREVSINAVVAAATQSFVASRQPSNGTIIAGAKGSRFVTFPELKGLPMPEATSTFKPVPFYDFVTKVLDGLYDRRMRTVDEKYIISQDGMKLYGLIELEQEYDGVRFAVGLKTSNDKSTKLALACGYRVMCCSNGALSGDFIPLAVKHSANLDIDDALALGIDRIRRRFGNVQLEIADKKARELSDRQAEHIIYQAFTFGKFPISLFRTIHNEYFVEPSYKEFSPRTLWSLENAFTQGFKKLLPMQQFEATSKLAKFLLEHRN